jgi:hypothetical protein
MLVVGCYQLLARFTAERMWKTGLLERHFEDELDLDQKTRFGPGGWTCNS